MEFLNGKKVSELSECVADKKATHIVPIVVGHPEKYYDFDFLDCQLANHSKDAEEEWFGDKRIGKWSNFVKTLTSKDLSSIE